MKFKFETSLNTFNIFATLILGLASLFISYNSYILSQKQADLSERQDILETGQQNLELKNAILALINTSSMLRQSEKDYPNIMNCIEAFGEMKSILESQLKNNSLIENSSLAKKWTELLMDINFNIKFFQKGMSPNITIDGAYDRVKEMETKSTELLKVYSKKSTAK